MIKNNIIIIFLILYTITAFADNDALLKKYPSLNRQLSDLKSRNEKLVDKAVLKKLENYLNRNEDIQKGFEYIIADSTYSMYDQIKKMNFSIDGNDSLSAIDGLYKEDEAGDGVPGKKNSDILKAAAFVDNEKNMIISIKTAEKIDDDIIVQPVLYPDNSDKHSYIIYYKKNHYQMIHKTEGSQSESIKVTGFEAACDSVFEMKIPLKSLFDFNNIEHIKIWTGLFYNDKYDGMWLTVPANYNNYALELLLFLIKENCFKPDDSITCALAYANNWLYAISDKETRKLILEDMVKHYKFYIKTGEWQEKSGLPYNITDLPFLPKFFWSTRYRWQEYYYINEAMNTNTLHKLNSDIYIKVIDRIETYEKLFNLINKDNLIDKSITKTAANIESWLTDENYIYRTRIETYKEWYELGLIDQHNYNEIMEDYKNNYYTDYLGKKYTWSDFAYINYQFNNRFFKSKKIRGDCGTQTSVFMGFYKAAGIAPVSLQRIPEGLWEFPATHNYPAYYHPFLKRWMIHQKFSNKHPDFKAHTPMTLLIDRPYYHHIKFNYDVDKIRFGGKSINQRYYTMMQLGIDKDQIEFFFNRENNINEDFFSDNNSPLQINDKDNDKLYDRVEKKIGTKADNYDSDGDRYSDFWEIEFGFDPKKPGKQNNNHIAMDGYIDDILLHKNVIVKNDSANDNMAKNNIFDIHKFYVSIIDNNFLYAGINYHNPTYFNTPVQHELWIVTYPGLKEYWIGGYSDNFNEKSTVMYLKDNKWEYMDGNGFSFTKHKDAEFLIPLKELGMIEEMLIKYTVPGEDDSSIRVADEVSYTFISLTDKYLVNTDGNMEQGKKLYKKEFFDKKNDFIAEENIYDIKKLYILDDKNFYFIAVEYHNDIRNNEPVQHELFFTDNRTNDIYWIAGYPYNNKFVTGKLMKYTASTKKWETKKAEKDIIFISETCVKARIPKKYFENNNSFTIKYVVAGGYDKNYVRFSDEVEFIY